MRTNVIDLSEKILGDAELDEVNFVIIDIAKGDSEEPLNRLAAVLGMKPKRPLYYVAHEISLLPEYGSRNIIRYCGDYIDQLVRFTLEDKRYLSKWFLQPLGSNIRKLRKYIDPGFFEILYAYNEIYVQAKHEFNHREDESLFSYPDAVHVVYITRSIAKRLLTLSECARDYNDQGQTAYRYHPVD